MSNGEKKISFSFSKVKNPPLRAKKNDELKEKVEFVDCFDGTKGKFSYKGNVRNEESKKPELVIPMVASKNSLDIRARIEDKFKLKSANKTNDVKESNSHPIKNECGEKVGQEMSLNEIAAAEILNEIRNGSAESAENNLNVIVIEQSDKSSLNEEETNIDYDQVPVSDFGKAMLRGMGWKPDYGIGKKPRLVPTVSPVLRPKGLGLGAKPNSDANADQKKNPSR